MNPPNILLSSFFCLPVLNSFGVFPASHRLHLFLTVLLSIWKASFQVLDNVRWLSLSLPEAGSFWNVVTHKIVVVIYTFKERERSVPLFYSLKKKTLWLFCETGWFCLNRSITQMYLIENTSLRKKNRSLRLLYQKQLKNNSSIIMSLI